MRNLILFVTAWLLWIAPVSAASSPIVDFDWKPWRSLPVQDGGRQKPFDTLARESARMMSNRTGFSDPETGQYLDPTALYLSMLFDWQGWDQPASSHPPTDMDFSKAYYRSHKPDKWDQTPLLLVGTKELRKALGIATNQKYISPSDLKDLKFSDPQSAVATPFLDWAEKHNGTDRKIISPLEKQALDLAAHYWTYLEHRMGLRMDILPFPNNPHQEWASFATVMQSNYDDKTDPDSKIRKVKDYFQKARAAYRNQNLSGFNEASTAFLNAVQTLGPEFGKDGKYPSPEHMNLEVAYNQYAPFRIAWILSLVAFLCVLPSRRFNSMPLYVTAVAIFAAGIAVMFAGFALRCMIADRPPITNMYESVLSVGVGIALLGMIYELIYRKHYVLIAASALSALVLLLAESSPALFDPSIRPLPPVLRNRFWLWVHVVPIMASYAAFAVTWILANVSLGGYLSGNAGKELMNVLSKLTLKILRIGVFLLTAGTILGGFWADYSWGRFWGWDPKEVWALISLLFYLNILHARYVGWIADFGMAIWSVISFVVVIMTWYGVNFVLGTGMHSYGFGGGNERMYVGIALAVQIAYLLAAVFMKYAKEEALERVNP